MAFNTAVDRAGTGGPDDVVDSEDWDNLSSAFEGMGSG